MKPSPEVEELIHLMRQSKMDAIREYLERYVKLMKRGSSGAGIFLADLKLMFKICSSTKPK